MERTTCPRVCASVSPTKLPRAFGSALRRFVAEERVNVLTRRVGAFAKFAAQRVAEPLKRTRGGERDAHHVPFAANRVTERVDAPERIVTNFVRVNESDPARSERRRKRARANDSDSDRARRAVSRAADHDAVCRETERVGGGLS